MTGLFCKLLAGLALLLMSVLVSYPYDLASVVDDKCLASGGFSVCQGDSAHDCSGTSFAVTTSGTYYLTASIDHCGEGSCSGCVAEAYLYEGARLVICVHSACCGAQRTAITLIAGCTYTLTCCLLPCEDRVDGARECAHCPARAEVHS